MSRASVLRGITIFAGLQDDDLSALSARMGERSFAPGQAMFREGEAGDELFVIVSGLVSVSVRPKDAEDIELSRVGTGAFFGEMAILERAPRSATCTAVEPTVCLALKAADFDALLAERPLAAVRVLDSMLGVAAGRLLSTGSFLAQMVQWGDDARKRAVTDAATGLFNRRYLEDSFEPMVARSGREDRPLSFAMFDLDRFGRLNAEHGAEFCDALVVRVAESFRRVFGDDDILVRYGGDEFCFVIQSPPTEAERKCEAVCEALRSLPFPDKPGLRVSCSIGLAHFPSSASGGEELKAKADKALYLAKEGGRDRAVAWKGDSKRDIPTIAQKNRVIANIVAAIEHCETFLVAGHKDPDEDCVSSMVAFSLLVTKFNKKASIVIGASVQDNYGYLLNICRFNSIDVIREEPLPRADALVFVDTPKPDMVDAFERYDALRADPSVLKLEFDHHLEADSRYIGDPDYCLVYEASSTCEILGFLALKIESNRELKARLQLGELLTRNLVLAILSGMIGDSQMGRYLTTRRERWFYARFSALFERMLARKTHSGSGNFSSKEQVFDALAALSKDEDACFRFMSRGKRREGRVAYAILDAEASARLFATYGNDTAVAVSKVLVDGLADESGALGLVGYYDDPVVSPFVQFRLRRCQGFAALDLRDAIARLGVTNGGGHPGAVGFRMERSAVADIVTQAGDMARALSAMADEAAAQG